MALDLNLKKYIDNDWHYLSLTPEALDFSKEIIDEFRLKDLEKVIAFKRCEDEPDLYDFAWVSNITEGGDMPKLEFYNLGEIEEFLGFDFSRFEKQFNDNTDILASGVVERCTEDQVNLLATVTVESLFIEIHERKMEQLIDYATPTPKNGMATVTHISEFTASGKGRDTNEPNPV